MLNLRREPDFLGGTPGAECNDKRPASYPFFVRLRTLSPRLTRIFRELPQAKRRAISNTRCKRTEAGEKMHRGRNARGEKIRSAWGRTTSAGAFQSKAKSSITKINH